MNKFWSNKTVLHLPLLPISWIFGAIARLRRWWLTHLSKPYRAPVPVIIVGNISVGGNGKTPVVIWLVELLRRAGYKPGVVSRGYGGKADHYPFTVDVRASPAEVGDEPLLIHLRCGCPVVVAPNRSAAVRQLLRDFPDTDVVISDDGLQHYALARDIELAIIDGERRLGNRWLLPAGPLREPASRLKKVFAVICNGGLVGTGEVAMQLKPQPVCSVRTQLPAQLSGPVDAMAGIGYPPRFFNTLKQLQFDVVNAVAYADHQAFNPDELLEKFSQRPLIMTEKDAVKCRQFAAENWYYLPVSAVIPDHFAYRLLAQLKELQHGPRL